MMKMKRLLLVVPFLFFMSCEKLITPKSQATNPRMVFDELWRVMDRGYGGFESRHINWDSVYRAFDTLVSDTMNATELYNISTSLLAVAQDGDLMLDIGYTQWRYSKPYFAPDNFSEQVLRSNYWGQYEMSGGLIYTVIDSCSYLYCRSFKDPITDDQMKQVVTRLEEKGGLRGTIIDIRSNEGGDVENLYTLMKHIDIPDSLESSATFLFKVAYRNGPKHDNFTQYNDIWVDESRDKKLPGKVAVLINRNSYGVANMMANACESFSNILTIGDTTSGGGSFLLSAELPNGWHVHYPTTHILSPLGDDLTFGVRPKRKVDLSASDEAAGKDTILEAALKELGRQ